MEVLDAVNGVPKVSRHADAAAIARVVIKSARLSSGLPTADDLREAADLLSHVYLDGGDDSGDARDRLTTVVREAAFGWMRDNYSRLLPVDGGAVFGNRPDEDALRGLLEQSYRVLTRQARDAEAHDVLIDRANTIRPVTFL